MSGWLSICNVEKARKGKAQSGTSAGSNEKKHSYLQIIDTDDFIIDQEANFSCATSAINLLDQSACGRQRKMRRGEEMGRERNKSSIT